MEGLLKCSQCDGQISVHAVMMCPHCGCPAKMALTQTHALKAKPNEEPTQELDVTKYFEVAAISNTKQVKEAFGTKGFGLSWRRNKLEWRGKLTSEQEVQEFVEFCKKNNVGFEVPPQFTNIQKPTYEPEATQITKSNSSGLPPPNMPPEVAASLDKKNNIGPEWQRRTDEGIAGSREDWKKNRKGYSGDMGYGKS